jgi:hypothetical protein
MGNFGSKAVWNRGKQCFLDSVRAYKLVFFGLISKGFQTSSVSDSRYNSFASLCVPFVMIRLHDLYIIS